MSADSPTPILRTEDIKAARLVVTGKRDLASIGMARLLDSHEALRDAVAVLTEEREARACDAGIYLGERDVARRRVAVLEAGLPALKTLVAEQAEDEGVWFIAEHAPEAYLQQELRRLHVAIEELQ